MPVESTAEYRSTCSPSVERVATAVAPGVETTGPPSTEYRTSVTASPFGSPAERVTETAERYQPFCPGTPSTPAAVTGGAPASSARSSMTHMLGVPSMTNFPTRVQMGAYRDGHLDTR